METSDLSALLCDRVNMKEYKVKKIGWFERLFTKERKVVFIKKEKADDWFSGGTKYHLEAMRQGLESEPK